jgi:glycosyltransferase involved in cell wall biosynthesis
MRDSNTKRTVAVIFSHGVGLRSWLKAGFFSREVNYYREIAQSIGGVTFLTYDSTDPVSQTDIPSVDPINVVFKGRLNHRIFGLFGPLLRYRELKSADVIKTNQFNGSWTGLILKWIIRKPLIARCGYIWSLNVKRSGAGRLRNWVTKFVEGFVLKRSDAIPVPDEFAVKYLSNLHGIAEERFTILPNYVDTDQFVVLDESERSTNQFIFVGRLSEEKRPELAIGAASKVPDAQLDVYGGGATQAAIEEQAAEIANVNVHGAIPYSGVSSIMSKARGLVITSRYEGSPKAVIESMASGLPVIAVKSPGLIEIVEHGVNGLLVEPDEQSIANAISRLMTDTDLWRELSTNGRRIAEDIYSKKSVMSKEISLINRLTNSGSSGV